MATLTEYFRNVVGELQLNNNHNNNTSFETQKWQTRQKIEKFSTVILDHSMCSGGIGFGRVVQFRIGANDNENFGISNIRYANNLNFDDYIEKIEICSNNMVINVVRGKTFNVIRHLLNIDPLTIPFGCCENNGVLQPGVEIEINVYFKEQTSLLSLEYLEKFALEYDRHLLLPSNQYDLSILQLQCYSTGINNTNVVSKHMLPFNHKCYYLMINLCDNEKHNLNVDEITNISLVVKCGDVVVKTYCLDEYMGCFEKIDDFLIIPFTKSNQQSDLENGGVNFLKIDVGIVISTQLTSFVFNAYALTLNTVRHTMDRTGIMKINVVFCS